MTYALLTEQERYVISHLSVAGLSLREIGRRINRSHTTISRELKRAGLSVRASTAMGSMHHLYSCLVWHAKNRTPVRMIEEPDAFQAQIRS